MRNLLRGLILGVFVARGLSLWATVIRFTSGTDHSNASGATYGKTLINYYAGFVIGGLLIGLLLPIRRHAWGSMLLGFLFVLPVYSAFIVFGSSSNRLDRVDTLGALIISAVAGGGLGLWVWFNEYRSKMT